MALNPNFSQVLPNHLTFKYFQPSTNLSPKHTPLAEKYPGEWKYYDVDLDAIKSQVADNVFFGAKDQTREEFIEREKFLEIINAYINVTNNKKPEVGQYEPQPVEKHIAQVDFEKMEGRDKYVDEDFLEDLDREGDVLVLDPHSIPDHLPGFEMAKQYGRGEDFSEFIEPKDELIIEPNKDFVKKRQFAGGAIPLEKQVGRAEDFDPNDDEVYLIKFPADAIPNDPSKPRVRGFSLEKAEDRFKYEPDEPLFEKDELVMPAYVKPLKEEKVLFRLDKGPERFKVDEKEEPLDLVDKKGNQGTFEAPAYPKPLPKEIVLVDMDKGPKNRFPDDKESLRNLNTINQLDKTEHHKQAELET